MNFNKNYPIAILDTNIVMDVPNILGILKGCNIVIPYTLIEELDNHKKENKGARDFVNNFLALSEKANLSKDGYKLENDCMLYVDRDNLSHKDVKLDSASKKEDIKFIAVQKNLKEKYNDMAVVLISSDKIMKITASTFDVKVKFLEEFITEYLKEEFKSDVLFGLLKEYIKNNDTENYNKVYEIICKILSNNKDVNGLYKLSENYNPNQEVYQKIFEILSENKDIHRLYKLVNYNYGKDLTFIITTKELIYQKIFEILSENKDIHRLYKLVNYNYGKDLTFIITTKELIYQKIYDILLENKDVDGLYELAENKNIDYKVQEFDKDVIYKIIFKILYKNKNIDGLYKLIKKITYYMEIGDDYYSDYKKLIERIENKIEELENKK